MMIGGCTERSRMRRRDPLNDTVWTQPVLETRKLLSPIGDELSSSPVIPDDLILEILLRLPAISLIKFRCVCKSWKTRISDPQFAKDHLRSSISNPSMTHQMVISSVIAKPGKVLTFSTESLFKNPSTLLEALSLKMSLSCRIIGSCNGLLCLYDIYQGCVKLWNPSTGLESEISPTIVLFNEVLMYHGFGYDQVNDKYKVLAVVLAVGASSSKSVTRIHTFGANSWTTIQKFRYIATTWAGKFVSGTLNWIATSGGSSYQWVILSLDLEKETYAEFLVPEQDCHALYDPVLGVLNNHLYCLCLYSNKTHWVVWMMKKYGVVESWTKLMVIPDNGFLVPSFDPLCISENGAVLLKTKSSKIVLYNPNNGLWVHPGIFIKLACDVHVYHGSLVSP